MKNLQNFNSFFGGNREETHEDLRLNLNRPQFFTNLFHADYNEILSTFSIPVLVIILSILLAHTAKGQNGSRLSDYFENSQDPVESYSVPPRMGSAFSNTQANSIPTPQAETMVQKEQTPVPGSNPVQTSEPAVRTYALPSGGMVREYRGEGGMLIRENHWSDSPADWQANTQDQAAREQAIREQAIREQAIREQAVREQAIREEIAREQAAREQAIREEVAREFAERAAKEQKSQFSAVPASISLDDEPEKAETKTEPNAKTTVSSQSERGLKTWNTSGLIPQNWSDNEEIACEDQMALPAPPALIESPFENQKSVTRETLASAQTPASAETEMFEIQTPAQSNELVPPSEMTAFTNDIKTAIYNQKYETAVNAIQETNEPIQSFTMEPISRKDVEEGWKVAPKQNIQQVSHVEMQPEPLGKANPAAGSGMKRLAAPRKGNHEKTASSQKRFQIEVSEKALGEIISAGEKAPVISAAENTIEAENNEIPATVEMNQSVELPESEKTEIAENVPEKKVKQTLNIFDFGIEDMQVFKENEDFSSEKTDVDANLNDPFSSSSMCCVEEENENGEVISVSESTSTISAIYYESCKNRCSVRTISYENKDKAPAKDPKSG